MVKTILVDDEPRGLNSLKKMLEQNCPDVKIIAECNNAVSAVQKINLLEPQLVFLDISMPGKNGFDLLNELECPRFETIFVTAHTEYSLNAFKYSAVDYLLKPVDEDLLTEAVKRAEKRINNKETIGHIETFLYNLQKHHRPHEMKLCVPSLKGFQVVNLSDVIYCEAETNYTVFHLINKQQIIASRCIAEYESLLENTPFCRIHKSFLVNLSHIKEYQRGEGGTVILTNSMEVEVSRRKKETFITKMKEMYKY
jgi:two-component system, LytTR family, response regulator